MFPVSQKTCSKEKAHSSLKVAAIGYEMKERFYKTHNYSMKLQILKVQFRLPYSRDT